MFPRDVLSIIFFHAGPFPCLSLRIVCKRWQTIIDSSVFKRTVEINPTCIIPARTTQEEVNYLRNFAIATYPFVQIDQKRLDNIESMCVDEIVQFKAATTSVSAADKQTNMPVYWYIQTPEAKIKSDQDMDAFFAAPTFTRLTEDISNQKMDQLEMENRINEYCEAFNHQYNRPPMKKNLL